MNKSKGKKAGKICENILFVIGILGIVILYWYDRSITLDPNIKESYTGEYPRYVSEVNEDDIPDEEYYSTMEEALQKADVYYDEYEHGGIERNFAGVPQIEVTFNFDKNRVLHVSSRDLKTGTKGNKDVKVR